jgi:Domain of unknown function (DUF5060)
LQSGKYEDIFMNAGAALSWMIAGLFLMQCLPTSAAPPQILSVRQTQPPEAYLEVRAQISPESMTDKLSSIGRYEKLELRIDLRATYENPYDPDEVDLWAEFTAPSGKVWKIWGFYNPSSWSALWMLRFSPDETGAWRMVLKVRDREGLATGKPQGFTVTESRHHGFVGLAANKRYLQYSDGSSFYGIGMWYNDRYDLFNRGQITEAGLDDLKRHGANFICFYGSPLETMGTGLGRYDENRAGRLDQIFEWCEQRDLQISWNIWFHSFISEKVGSAYSTRYRNNPYRLVTTADEFFTSEEAWKHVAKLHRYLVARWGYSRALFLWFVIDEANRTEGWEKGGRESCEHWCRRVHDWFKANDPYRRPTTGTITGGLKDWWPGGYEIFDIAARELYETRDHPMPAGSNLDLVNDNPLKASYLNYVKQTQALWNGFAKPVMFGECGARHAFFDHTLPGYSEMHHNALWAALVNGQCMTPFWWDHDPDFVDVVADSSLLHLSGFARDIPFAAATFKPVNLKLTRGDGWAMQSDDLTFGWAVNPLNGVSGETISVPGLADGDYDVRFYLPWGGEYLDPVPASSAGGALTVKIPESRPRDGKPRYFGPDVAFKIVRHKADNT